MAILLPHRVPTVTLRHKRKGTLIKINQSDWSQDLGRFKYSAFERVNERHNQAERPIEINTPPPVEPMDNSPVPVRRRRGRPRKNP